MALTSVGPEDGAAARRVARRVRQRPLVLHVIEAWGGGVASAVHDYTRSTPDYDHVLLVTSRPGHDTGELAGPNVVVRPLPAHLLPALREIGRLYSELRPDIVHAHSSFAGALTRLSRVVPASRTVYTPHCYAFERTDVSAPLSTAYLLVERLLAGSAKAVVACSPREADLARLLSPSSDVRVSYVPNVARLIPDQVRGGADLPDAPFTVVGVGRLSEQKDPAFFRQVAEAVRAQDPAVQFSWLGGGPAAQVMALRASGIHVSGWLERPEVCARLGRADVYLHTAAWEGAPVSVLEAAALGLPVVGRDIPALASLALPDLAPDPVGVGRLVLDLRDPERYRAAVSHSAALTARHAPQVQAESLNALYASVLAG